MRPRTSTASAPLLPVSAPDIVARARTASPLARVLKALRHRVGWAPAGGWASSRKPSRGSRAGVTLAVLLLIAGLRKLVLAPPRSGGKGTASEWTSSVLDGLDDPPAAGSHPEGGGSRARAQQADWCASPGNLRRLASCLTGLTVACSSPDSPRAHPCARSARPAPATEGELAAYLDAEPSSVSTGDKQRAIAGMIAWAWKGYAEFAFGSDDLRPLSRTGHQWVHLGATIVDSLDTLLIAGLSREYAVARAWAVDTLDVATNHDVYVNTFETTIRVLGGLLSAHHLTPGGDAGLLAKALDLAPRLGVACNATPTGIPLSDVNLATRHARAPAWTTDASVAEAATLSLEFVAASAAAHHEAAMVAHVPGQEDRDTLAWLADAGLAAQQAVIAAAANSGHGLVTHKFISTQDGSFRGEHVVTLGARVDSTYEYLLKGYLQAGKSDEAAPLLTAYQDAVHGVTTTLLRRMPGQSYLYIAERPQGGTATSSKMDHLVCFWPGLLALGHANGVRARPEQEEAQGDAFEALGMQRGSSQLDVAHQLAAGCRAMYDANPLGMGPEIAYYDGTGPNAWGVNIHPGDAHSLLRPEYIESLFYLWRLTGNDTYRDWAWDAAMAIQRHARVPTGGYASVDSVLAEQAVHRDHMESFFLGETLKYLYLVFEDDTAGVVPLDKWVFNTEAHPLPVVGERMKGVMRVW